MKKAFFLLATLLFVTSDAWAAARYWVGGTGNWDAADTTHWSASSGGAGGASVPGASDDVTFDASSGGGTVTVTATVNVLSITGGAHTGTLNTNGQSITVSTFNYSGTGTRTLTLGASSITVTGTAQPSWTTQTGTNLTFNANTSTITMTGTSSAFYGGGQTYANVIYTGRGKTTDTSITTFGNLTITGDATKTDSWAIGASLIVTGTLTINGNSSTNRLLIRSGTLGTVRTITAANVSISNADFRDITGAGAASWDLSAITGLSGDCGGNSGITFTTAATQTYTGGTGSWSDVTKWTSRVPLPQDDVSMSGVTGGTITADMPRLGKSIDWTGASGTPIWSFSSTNTNYGSLTLISGMSISSSGYFYFEGRGNYTLTSSGKSMMPTWVQMVGGKLTLQDAYTSSGQLVVNYGTLEATTFNVSVPSFYSIYSVTRGITLGSGVWSITSTGAATNWGASSTAMTFSAGTSTIFLTSTSANANTFAGGGLTYNDLKIAGGGAGAVIITGANTFNRIYTNGGGTKSITLPGSTTTTILSGQGLGNGTNVITFTASAGSATVAKASGTLAWDYVNLTNIPASGGAKFYAGSHSTDGGGNTNWIFRSAPSGGFGAGSKILGDMDVIDVYGDMR